MAPPDARTMRQQARLLARQQDAAIFEHICEEILDIESTSPAKLALDRHGIKSKYTLLSLRHDDINQFMYVPAATSNGPPVDLDTGNKNLIRLFLGWYHTLLEKNGYEPLNETQWMATEGKDFNNYRERLPIPRPPTSSSVPSNAGTNGRQVDAVAEFKKGIKRDAAIYPMLKDQKHWDAWNRSLVTQAKAHDVHEVLDLSYAPPDGDQEAKDLFDQKQIFVYSVLNKCVMTDQGKSFV